MAHQLLIKQIRSTNDIATFLFIYTEDGLKSSNIRLRLKSIQSLIELVTVQHQYENLSPIFEILVQCLQDHTLHPTYNDIVITSLQHMKRILGADLLNTYLETYPPSVRRIYYTSIPQNEIDQHIPTVDTDLEDDDETPRASVQVSQIRDAKEKSIYSHSGELPRPIGISSNTSVALSQGTNGLRSHIDQHPDDLQHLHPIRKASLPPQPTSLLAISNESADFHSIVELMRSKWLAADESNRLDYLERFKQTCDKYLQSIRTQHLSTGHDTQFHQVLHSFLTAILDLLFYLTSSNLDLSIRIKLVLSTCLGWLIKHAQVIYCKRNYKTICTVFKNILLHGQSNNRQLAVSVSSFKRCLISSEARKGFCSLLLIRIEENVIGQRSFGFPSNR